MKRITANQNTAKISSNGALKKVVIIALEHTAASTVTAPMDAFFLAGRLWQVIHQQPANPYFEVVITSFSGEPITCLNGLQLVPRMSIDCVQDADLVLISSLTGGVDNDFTAAFTANAPLIPHLQRLYNQGATLASCCTGAFLLAATGLLDHKRATTHWGFAKVFTNYFPDVNLQPEKIVTDEGRLLCSGGANSCIDLCFYLIQKYCGKDVAVQTAKAVAQSFGRTSQLPFSHQTLFYDHTDDAIQTVQQWMNEVYMEPLSVEDMASRVHLSRRTFERRFKKATGEAPGSYLQQLRINQAKHILETSNKTVNEVAYNVGYDDVGAFTKIFKKYTDLLPGQYRRLYLAAFE